ncbi:sulfatase [Haloarcula argentinensis]|uniref:Sulfatase-like hydrolase/transferase n=1 Tax=Haloarcula argentinensis TaxID=43776 RepID=A0A847UN21_HALAR|nr:sulfatase [Haloarcula argentinensis]NLV12628.1 sulfatase-like hydrolase/transferase [Haloarcula argentinensis]
MVENVLFITIDSLRFDSTPSPEDRSKSIFTQVEAEAVSFSRAFATGPGTTPSFPAMLTGTLPLSYDGLGPLTTKRPRVSTHLRNSGMTVAGFQCNPFLSNHFNYEIGYDAFEDYQNPLMGIATKIFPRGIEINNPKLRRIDETLHLTDAIKKSYQLLRGKPRPYVSAEVITDDTIEWLEATDEPFYCWTHYMDVHHPCFPPAEYRERYGVAGVTQSEVSEWYSELLQEPETLTDTEIGKLEALYEAAIDYTDDQIGRILDHLRETGRYENTLIIITSDHGELFGEHGQYGKPERMYDELLHVPLVVANGPDYLEDASDQLISLLDVPPLIHDALRFDVPDAYEGRIPGVDAERDVILAEHEVDGDVVVGARSDNWLYEADEILDENRLFDLRNGTFKQIKPDHPEASAVRQAVQNRLDELDVEAKYLQGDVESDVEGRLEDLGYL